MARRVYQTELVAEFGGMWWSVGDDSMELESYMASGYAERQPHFQSDHVNPCGLEFESPMPHVVEFLNDLALRVSIISAIDSNATQRVEFFGSNVVPQWRTKAWWAIACLACSLMTHVSKIICHMQVWWKGWKEYRQSEMRPSAVARAMGPAVFELAEMEARRAGES